MHTEQDTFDRLRRVSYAEACTAYTMVFMEYHAQAGDAWCKEWAREILKPLGWTLESLAEYERTHDVIS